MDKGKKKVKEKKKDKEEQEDVTDPTQVKHWNKLDKKAGHLVAAEFKKEEAQRVLCTPRGAHIGSPQEQPDLEVIQARLRQERKKDKKNPEWRKAFSQKVCLDQKKSKWTK